MTNDLREFRALAEIGMCAALALALSFVTVWQLPFGGKVSLEMLPIAVIARLRGFRAGSLTGLAFGILDLIREPRVVHPIQFLLDYPLPFACLGAAGLFPLKAFWDIPSIFFAGVLRFLCHFLSGVVFFKSYVPHGENLIRYSFLYNASYLVPSLVATVVLSLPVLKALRGAFHS